MILVACNSYCVGIFYILMFPTYNYAVAEKSFQSHMTLMMCLHAESSNWKKSTFQADPSCQISSLQNVQNLI